MASTRLAWRQDIAAGIDDQLAGLCRFGGPRICSVGLDYAATGAAAGLCGAIVAGIVSAIFATTSLLPHRVSGVFRTQATVERVEGPKRIKFPRPQSNIR